VGLALATDLPLSSLYVDPLVIPIGVDPMAGQAVLDAISAIRARFGDDIHITGGVSNISFGLPARRIISDVFLDLCVAAGLDSGIIDPVADVSSALNPDRDSEGYTLARAMLTGEDAFGMAFITAFREGRFES
jgi:cobalamin-dependent methionine synthase I